MKHNIKITKEAADLVKDGKKPFEIRKNDRLYQAGDRIQFTVIDQKTGAVLDHALNIRTYKITCVISGWGLKNDYVAFGIQWC